MATQVTYTGNGSKTDFDLTFPYLNTGDIYVTVDGAATSYTWVTGSKIRISPAPASSTSVRIYRATSLAARATDYTNGSVLTEGDLDKDSLQAFYALQEAQSDLATEVADRAAEDARAVRAPSGQSAPALPWPVQAGKWLATDAFGAFTWSNGTGTDSGLRADLSGTTGANLVRWGSRVLSSKLNDFYNVKDGGCAADGATDDATALQTILNNQKRILATSSAGCAIATGLTLTVDDVAVEGLKLKPSTTRNMTALTVGATSPDATTTLAVNAAAMAFDVTLNSVTGFAAGKLVLFTFDNPTWTGTDAQAANYRFVTRIVAVNTGTKVVTLQDALPHAIQSAWTHSVQAWTPTKNPKLRIELDQSAHGQKRTITAITQANPAVFTTDVAHGFTTGDTVEINGPLTGMTQMRSAQAAVTVLSPTTFSLPINASAYSAYTGGATVRQLGCGVRIGCVDGCDIEIVGYDNDGLGALLQVDLAYNPRIRVVARNCGNGNRGDVQTFSYTGGSLEIISDDPSGFGPTLMGGHYATVRVASTSRSDLGRNVKIAKTKYCRYEIGPSNNPAFTAIAAAWVTQNVSIYCGAAIASARAAVQPVGFWTSGCYNTGIKVFGLDADGSTNYDAQVNATDSVTFIGCDINKLDMAASSAVTMIGGSYTTLSGAGAGSIKLLVGARVKLSGNQVVQLTDATFGYPLVVYGSGANGMAIGADASGNGTFFTDREVLRLMRGEPTSGQTGLFLVYHNGTSVVFQQVTLGAADSGGVGFKALRVPN